MKLSRYFPWAVVLASGFYLLSIMARPAEGPRQMHLHEFGNVPAVDGGRLKPLDTFARNSLMVISGRQTFRDEDGKEQPAIRWFLDAVSTPHADGPAMKHRVVRIENDEVLSLLKLEPREGFRYSLGEIAPKLKAFESQVKRSNAVPPEKQSVFDRKILELAGHLEVYVKLANGDIPLSLPPKSEREDWQSLAQVQQQIQLIAFGPIRAELAQSGLTVETMTEVQKGHLMDRFQEEVDRARGPVHAANPAVPAFERLTRAYETGKADDFNKALADYRKHFDRVPAEDLSKAGFETFFNDFAPFYQCSLLYVLVFLLACGSWLSESWSRPLRLAALSLAVLTLVVHTWALGARMYIQGRPPVTNLYSSAIFIGWGCVILALVLEVIYRNGVGNVMAAVTGFLTLLIAHNLASGGDTLEMMQAVLDTNFWLATHVTAVTTGYAATFMAGFLGLLFIIRGFNTRTLDREAVKTLGSMIYGIICFATLFSFVGTVLGGIWADQSWGRFWGWDPKENGALIIVLWNALALHARWGGMVQQRGLAVLAVAGNIVTAWSWFGVNMLGVGLHSYGFMSGAVFWLIGFVFSQLIFIGIGMLPLRYWRSFAVLQPPSPKSQPMIRQRQEEAMVAS